jgi:hypothetical protein
MSLSVTDLRFMKKDETKNQKIRSTCLVQGPSGCPPIEEILS